MNALVDYIKTHPAWRTELTQKPYCLTIKDKGPYTIFSYSQIDSDFYNEVVRVSRGIILRIGDSEMYDLVDNPFTQVYSCDVKVVCWPFNKFGNYGEGYADKIDWASAKVQEKVDGSIIKLWHDGHHKDGAEFGWHISTNGMIDAFETDLQVPTDEFKCFGDIFMKAWSNSGLGRGDFYDACLDYDVTYIFELVSPWNRVVVPYKDVEIYFIGARNNITGEELDPRVIEDPRFLKRPAVYSFATFDEAVANAAALPFSQEGYVVVDKDWHRVKVKSKAYLQAHHLKDNGNVNPKRVLELIKTNEQDEFISYFPEYKEHFDKVKAKYEATLTAIRWALAATEEMKMSMPTKKDFAMHVLQQDPKLRKYMFAQWDGKDIQKLIDEISYDDLL